LRRSTAKEKHWRVFRPHFALNWNASKIVSRTDGFEYSFG